MIKKKTFKNLLLLAIVLLIASSLASALNIGYVLPGIRITGASTLFEAILGKLVFFMQLGVWLYLINLLIKYKNVNKMQIGSCVLIMHLLSVILQGENLFFLLSCIYCATIMCLYSRSEFAR